MDEGRAEGLIDVIYDYIDTNLELIVFDYADEILDHLVKQGIETTTTKLLDSREGRQEVIDQLRSRGYKIEKEEKELEFDFEG